MAIIASSQVINIMISILRIKVLAILLGPAGIGLLGIYNSLLGVMGTAAGLGMGSSGVRQIASAKAQEQELSNVRRVLMAAHLVQGVLAMLGVWLLRAPISEWLFDDRSYATEVGLIGLSVALTLLGTAQTALLQGMRQIEDLGRVTVYSAAVGTITGLFAVWLYGEAGLVLFVVGYPLATIMIAMRYTRRLPKTTAARHSAAELWEVWKLMAKFGAAVMVASLFNTVTLLLVRGRITQELGMEAAGQFSAAWGITVTYVGVLLGAMAADYYPRLTQVIKDRAAANRLINDQAQLGLAIGGPVLLLLIGLAPWTITILYSSEFAPAAELLQWQTVGNIFKLAGWALAFSIISAARSKALLLMDLSFNIVFLAMVWFLMPILGLKVTGIAFLVGYIVYFATVNTLARTLQGFHWQPLSLLLLTLHVAIAVSLLAVARTAPQTAAIASIFMALATGVFGLRLVLIKIGPDGRVAARISRIYETIGWPVSKKP